MHVFSTLYCELSLNEPGAPGYSSAIHGCAGIPDLFRVLNILISQE
jgi:hypothetical protein